MQRTNGVEALRDEETLSASAARPAKHKDLPADLLERLKVPLPAEAVSPNPQKPGLSTIKVIYVVERLNEVFGLNGWRVANQVVENGRMVVVKATLTIPKYGIAIEQYGGNENPDRGDAYKGACTDALSKCASYLGVGMDVYKGLHDSWPKNGANGQPGNGGGSSRASEATPPNRHVSGVGSGQPEPTGLTTRNWVERFAAMRRIIGATTYDAILSEHGYRDVTEIPTLEKAREVYRALIEPFRARYREARRQLGQAEYGKILLELQLNPSAKLSPDQAIRVYNYMAETLSGEH